ncbi:hypothetical protein HDU85_003192 [Gaertneriomyces sp. JEL0708]|nr:hypothetical protein HDU85_003192 [Gaertneriomyces sp. JEL0708]
MTIEEAASKGSAAKAKPCGVCFDFKSLRRKQAKEYKKEQHTESSSEASSSRRTAGATAALGAGMAGLGASDSSKERADAYTPFPCPPDSGELGRSGWTFLHTMAAYYPESPSTEHQESMKAFVNALGHFYPCGYCASHLRKETKRDPPDVSSNWNLSQWFCRIHNNVNRRQGKPEFDCSKVFERWRDGSPGSDCFPDIATDE